jgi:Creatinine amidohydrolase
MVLKSHCWWDLTTTQFATLYAERIAAILPVGGIEQHSPHLPVRVDAAINAGILARAVALLPACQQSHRRARRPHGANAAKRRLVLIDETSRYPLTRLPTETAYNNA